MRSWAGQTMASLRSAKRVRVVTPHLTNNLPDGACRALWIGGDGGNVEVKAVDDTDYVVFSSVPGGTRLDIEVLAVRSTNTTATSIVALY